ncbi:hypothetical protein [Leptospira jelokensis]|uniref:Uncharacterized protein n=1 Tax=Leptospira jelokensis TaxID=2484931 RepID=A0A4Z0ZZY0_9LEPT|nr:hypothetical protein [Leptospira jelokensis]TGL58630.1 hypothetical protein EHQ62_17195 [Leptospira jelokensis]
MEIGIKELITIGIALAVYFVRNENQKSVSLMDRDLEAKIQSNKDMIVQVKNDSDKSNERLMAKLGNIEEDTKRTENAIKSLTGESSATRDLVLKMYEHVLAFSSQLGANLSKIKINNTEYNLNIIGNLTSYSFGPSGSGASSLFVNGQSYTIEFIR